MSEVGVNSGEVFVLPRPTCNTILSRPPPPGGGSVNHGIANSGEADPTPFRLKMQSLVILSARFVHPPLQFFVGALRISTESARQAQSGRGPHKSRGFLFLDHRLPSGWYCQTTKTNDNLVCPLDGITQVIGRTLRQMNYPCSAFPPSCRLVAAHHLRCISGSWAFLQSSELAKKPPTLA
jgi:hypothetical protein